MEAITVKVTLHVVYIFPLQISVSSTVRTDSTWYTTKARNGRTAAITRVNAKMAPPDTTNVSLRKALYGNIILRILL